MLRRKCHTGRKYRSALLVALGILSLSRSLAAETLRHDSPVAVARQGEGRDEPTVEEARLALATGFRMVDDLRWTLNTRRKIGIAELLAEKDLNAIFPPGKKVNVGPVYRWRLKVYGPDVTYPLDPGYAQSLSLVLQSLLEDYIGFGSKVARLQISPGVVVRQRPADPFSELPEVPQGSLETSCGTAATFHEEHYRAADVWLEMSMTRDCWSAVSEWIGGDFRSMYNRWLHVTMKELGFAETHFLQGSDRDLLEKSLLFVNESTFMPATTFRTTLQMRGPCLFPFKAEKQTALQSVLEDLLSRSSHLFSLTLREVEQTDPIFTSRGMYGFVDVALIGGKYEGPGVLILEEMFSTEGSSDFAPGADGKSEFQRRMEEVGLAVHKVKFKGTARHDGDPPVSPQEAIRHWREVKWQQRVWVWSCAGGTALVAVATLGIIKVIARRTAGRPKRRGGRKLWDSYSGDFKRKLSGAKTISCVASSQLWNDVIQPSDLEMAHDKEGNPVVLGRGSFGKVRSSSPCGPWKLQKIK